jgi:hypothetical protein
VQAKAPHRVSEPHKIGKDKQADTAAAPMIVLA